MFCSIKYKLSKGITLTYLPILETRERCCLNKVCQMTFIIVSKGLMKIGDKVR